MTRKRIPDLPKPNFNRQNRLSVYGDGPYDAALGHPAGNEDVAQLVINSAFTLVRTDWLNALESLLETQKTRINQLEEYNERLRKESIEALAGRPLRQEGSTQAQADAPPSGQDAGLHTDDGKQEHTVIGGATT